MDTATRIVMLLSLSSVGAALHVIMRPRPKRFLLVPVVDAERLAPRARRARWFNAAIFLLALMVLLEASDLRTMLIALFLPAILSPIWMGVELWQGLKNAERLPIPSKFRASLAEPPRLASYLSGRLAALNLIAFVAPPMVLLGILDIGTLGPWRFFFSMMLFLTGLIWFLCWMQANGRWALPTEAAEPYFQLEHEKRARMIRLLETSLVLWNIAAALIWISIALGKTGPGYIGAILPIVLSGPAFVILLALRLPRLTKIADELTALAQTDALGTRRAGWRYGGLVYFSREDPALFVPKRSGLGQTLNLARPAAWLFVTAVVSTPPVITALSWHFGGS